MPHLSFVLASIELQSVETLNQCLTRYACHLRINLSCDFLWRDLDCKVPPTVYEWQVLPFGTTSSPCCAIYVLQRIKDTQADEYITHSIHNCFYVDNCLQSVPTPEEAKDLLRSLRTTLSSGGFEIRQWASNDPQVICDLPPEARSEQTELWLSRHPSLDPS